MNIEYTSCSRVKGCIFINNNTARINLPKPIVNQMHLYLKPGRDIYIVPFGDITKRNYTVIMDESLITVYLFPFQKLKVDYSTTEFLNRSLMRICITSGTVVIQIFLEPKNLQMLRYLNTCLN